MMMKLYRFKKVIMNIKYILYLNLLILLSINKVNADSSSNITWYQVDFAPFSILQGKDVGTGYCNRLQKFVIDKLPNYAHNVRTANFSRLLKEMENNELTCSVCVAKNIEREKYTSFSVASDVWIANGIIIRRAQLATFTKFIDENGFFDFSKYAQTTTFVTGYINKRVYGKSIDTIIEKHYNSSSVYKHKGTNGFRALLEMLAKERVDSVVGYIHELDFYSKALGLKKAFHFFPIKGNDALNYVGCSKSLSGKKLTNEITEIIEQHRETISGFYRSELDLKYKNHHKKISREYFNQ